MVTFLFCKFSWKSPKPWSSTLQLLDAPTRLLKARYGWKRPPWRNCLGHRETAQPMKPMKPPGELLSLMHLDPWHLRLQMEKLKIKNNWCHFFAHSFFWETIMAQNQTHQTTLFLLDIIRLAPKFLRKIGWHNSPRLFGGERHMEVSNRCHYYPDILHLTGTTLVGCSHNVPSPVITSKAPLR